MPTEASTTMPLGSPAPAFSLPDVTTGNIVSLDALPPSRALVVIFLCRHCPYVVHILDETLGIARAYQAQSVQFIGISSNDPAAYPDDAPDRLREMAIERQMPFPLLYDESQDVARAYDARCTPDFFVFDHRCRLAYHGRLDDSTPGNGRPVNGRDLRAALDAVLAERRTPTAQHPSLGCSIKWKSA